jgi:hypothetical protein
MPHSRHLENAPIVEAIIDLRVKARQGLRAEEFAGVKTQLEDRFPKMEERRSLEAGFEVRLGGSHASSLRDLGLYGYFFRAEDEKTITQFRVDGFTFNRLSTALLVSTPMRYPRPRREGTDGGPCEPRRGAGVTGGLERLPGALSAPGRAASLGTLSDGPARGVAQQAR